MEPFFSVIIPSFNRAQCLSRSLGSVAQQSFKDFEILFVDDGSTDQTQTQLANLQQGPLQALKFRSFFQNQGGVSSARNLGIRKARGRWLAFLDSDDEWLPTKLEQQFQMIQQREDLKIFHGEEIWIRNGVRVNPMKKHQKTGGWIYRNCLPLCCISPSTVVIHKDVFSQVGAFDESFEVCEDYELWLRITSQFEVGFTTENLTVKYGGHEDQLSRKYFAMDYWRVLALSKALSLLPLTSEQKIMTAEMLIQKADILIQGYLKHNNTKNLSEVEGLKIDALKILEDAKS